jgi:hypothetical protein
MSLMTRLFGLSERTTDSVRETAETAETGVEALAEGVERVETATEFLAGVADRLEDADMGSLATAVEASLPWLEGAGEVLGEAIPPVKAALKLIGLLTKEPDPRALGLLAFSLAYETALASAAKTIEEDPGTREEIRRPVKPEGLRRRLSASPESLEAFDDFHLSECFKHRLMIRADTMLTRLADEAGWSQSLQRRLLEGVHTRFRSSFRKIISDGRTKEKFDPLFRFMDLDNREAVSFSAIERHIEYQTWRFSKAPVLGQSRVDKGSGHDPVQPMRLPFSLEDIYVPIDCGALQWADITLMDRENSTSTSHRSPFNENEGGRHPLLEEVLRRIGDRDFREAIVIQGVAGSGKSAFTLCLCVELRKLGLRPVRIRMRHLALDSRSLLDDMAQAIAQNSGDDTFDQLVGSPRPTARDFDLNDLFDEAVPFGDAQICPHVLIFDGWDEISASASEGFLKQISNTLFAIRRQILLGAPTRVRVILTGRPSIDVAEAKLLPADTPLLTVRPFTDPQLRRFSDTLLEQHTRLMSGERAVRERRLAALMKFDGTSAKSDDADERILGLPLLALLAIWLTLSDEAGPEILDTDRTALYRRLVDITCRHGGSIEGEIPPYAPRLVGEELRKLLRGTATAMTIRDTENISYLELQHRLGEAAAPSGEEIRGAMSETPIATMMMSFFFHSGTREQGVEFIHKSFREYLFAEAVVETLKGFGVDEPAPRVPYWKNFEEGGLRRASIEQLAPMLAAQWITPEVDQHLSSLLEWEIKRARSDGKAVLPEETRPISLQRWKAIRDALADFWDWWAEGVHLRPQPFRRRDTGSLDYDEPYAIWLIRVLAPVYRPGGKFPEPIRTTTIDSHLGDALFRLNCAVHFQINLATGWLDRTRRSKEPIASALWEGAERAPRAYQTSIKDDKKSWIAFAPSTPDHRTHYFENFASRVNAAGWRPQGVFPSGVDMSGADLASATLPLRAGSVLPLRAGSEEPVVKLRYARLENADLNQTNISEADLSFTAASGLKCVLSHVQRSNFRSADLRKADFSFSTMMNADFSDATVEEAEFNHADIRGIDRAKLEGAKLETAWAAVNTVARRPEEKAR